MELIGLLMSILKEVPWNVQFKSMTFNMTMVGDSHMCVVEHTHKVKTHLPNLDNNVFCFYQPLRIDVHTST
jgi:hypothetical protein